MAAPRSWSRRSCRRGSRRRRFGCAASFADFVRKHGVDRRDAANLDWCTRGRRINDCPHDDAAPPSASAYGRQNWVLPPAPRIDSLALIDVVFTEPSVVPPEVDLVTKIAAGTKVDLPVEGALSGFSGSTEWLNSPPLTPQALRGKVVLVYFWTFNCINCLHALPYVRAWAEKYRDHGLVVIGVHTPELPFERDIGNVRKAVARLKIDYPVVIDNGYAIWKAFGNEYWPAAYFVDAEGRIRHHHFGDMTTRIQSASSSNSWKRLAIAMCRPAS